MFCKIFLIFSALVLIAVAAPASSQEPPVFRSDYKYVADTHAFYKLHRIRRTWADAVATCRAESAMLPTPATRVEADTLVAQLDDVSVNTWISLHDMFSEGDFQTVDGRFLSDVYVNWGLSEPNDEHNNEDCVVVGQDGFYNDGNCMDTKTFVCMKDQSTVTSNPDCETYDTGYILTSEPGRCYKLHRTPKNWNDAYKACRSEQTQLAVINSDREAGVLAALLAQYPVDNIAASFTKGSVHIGFNDLINHGVYLTVDGMLLEDTGYTTWADNQPDNWQNNEHCGSIQLDGRLNDVNCNDRSYFICEKRLKNSTAVKV